MLFVQISSENLVLLLCRDFKLKFHAVVHALVFFVYVILRSPAHSLVFRLFALFTIGHTSVLHEEVLRVGQKLSLGICFSVLSLDLLLPLLMLQICCVLLRKTKEYRGCRSLLKGEELTCEVDSLRVQNRTVVILRSLQCDEFNRKVVRVERVTQFDIQIRVIVLWNFCDFTS